MENKHLDAVYLFSHSARSPVCIDIQIARLSLAVWQITIHVSTSNNTHLSSPRCRPEVQWSWLDPLLRFHKAKVKVSAHSLLGEHSSLLAVGAKLLHFQRPPTLLISRPVHLHPSVTCEISVSWLFDFLFGHEQENALFLRVLMIRLDLPGWAPFKSINHAI